MAEFQSSLNSYSAAGLPGELAFSGPTRAAAFNLYSAGVPNKIGHAFTITGGGNPDPVAGSPNGATAMVGGTGVFAGILTNTHEYALFGDLDSPINPSLNLPDNSQGTLLTMGYLWVTLDVPATPGDVVYYDNTTGALGAEPRNAEFTGEIEVVIDVIDPAVAATGTLTLGANADEGDTVLIGTQEYTFTATVLAADDVLIGLAATNSIDNLIAAITNGAGEGTLYGTGTLENDDATAAAGALDTMTVTAKVAGADGNDIDTVADLADGDFGAATLTGGVNANEDFVATLTVSAVEEGVIGLGAILTGDDLPAGLFFEEFLTGTGGTGTYLVGGALEDDVAEQTMFTTDAAPAGKTLVPNCTVERFVDSVAGLAVVKLTN